MCGIFGCLCNEASDAIIDGLKRLEYRGYDSVGVAVISGGRLVLEKEKGKISEFTDRVDLSTLKGEIGLGHTRWATHGAPCKENAHPHLDCTKTLAVVHNGVLENFLDLKAELLKRGHIFTSNTDTEVIPHLIEEGICCGMSLKAATVEAAKKTRGSMAIAVMSTAEPDRIICVKRESPLVIGIGHNGAYCASDISALLPHTKRIIVVPDNVVAVLERKKVSLEDLNGNPVKQSFHHINWDMKMAEKGGFPHFMIKEIHEQPFAIANTLKLPDVFLDKASSLMDHKIYLTGSGTSYHACLTASYIFSKILCMDVKPVYSSEFQDAVFDLEGSTVIGVSQSGETADTLNALKHAKARGAKIIGITNTLGSSITTVSNAYICTQSGPEIGVAATKTLLTQLTALDLLTFRFGLKTGRIAEDDYRSKLGQMARMPKIVSSIIEKFNLVQEISLKYSTRRDAFFLARGINVATALEGALKLKEISYMHAEGYPAGESKHGPISLVEKDFLCVFIAPKDDARGKVIGNMMEMKARGADIFSIITEGDDDLKTVSDEYFSVPDVPEFIYPIICTVPLQAFAYYIAIYRGLDPDKPRNLAKSVTVL